MSDNFSLHAHMILKQGQYLNVYFQHKTDAVCYIAMTKPYQSQICMTKKQLSIK